MGRFRFRNGFAKILVLVYGAILLNTTPANSVFIHMLYKDDVKCFLEEIPDDTLVTVQLKLEVFKPIWNNPSTPPPLKSNRSIEAKLGLVVTVLDPTEGVIVQRKFEGSDLQHKFTFTSHMAGEHKLCLQSNSEKIPKNEDQGGLRQLIRIPPQTPDVFRVHTNIEIGGRAMDYEVIREKEKLTEIQLRIRKLNDLTDQIRKEQDYQRTREQRFRETSDSTNSRTFWFAVLQTILLLVAGLCQVRHLKTFFIMKKLV